MAYLVKIGNSQGIRIPKPLIEQTHLEGKKLILKVVDDGLFITPVNKRREGWEKSINKILAFHGQEIIDEKWLDAKLTSDENLEW